MQSTEDAVAGTVTEAAAATTTDTAPSAEVQVTAEVAAPVVEAPTAEVTPVADAVAVAAEAPVPVDVAAPVVAAADTAVAIETPTAVVEEPAASVTDAAAPPADERGLTSVSTPIDEAGFIPQAEASAEVTVDTALTEAAVVAEPAPAALTTEERLAGLEARYDQLLRAQDADRAYTRQLELSMQEIATKNIRMLSGVSNMMVNYSSTLSNLASDVNSLQNALNIPMSDRPKARLQVSLSSEPVNELSLYGTLHSETHPDFPDTFELRRKDLKESTPEKAHWDPVTIDDAGFMDFLKQHFLASNYAREQWCYVTLTNLPPDGSGDASAAASAAAAVSALPTQDVAVNAAEPAAIDAPVVAEPVAVDDQTEMAVIPAEAASPDAPAASDAAI